MQYIPRMGSHGYELAKFDPDYFGDAPEIYRIINKRCTCPSRKRPCKHVNIMNAWEKDGQKRGNVYEINETTNRVEKVTNLFETSI